MKNALLRAWESLWLWRLLFVVSVLALYFGDPLPWPNPADPDFGHGNFGVRDGQAFVDFDDAITQSTGIGRRFVIDEGTMQIGVYNAPHFVLTLTNRQNIMELRNGTGPSFQVSDPRAAAGKFALLMASKGYVTQAVSGFLPNHPDKLYLVQVKDPRYPEYEWWNQPLQGWSPAFRVRTTSMGLPKFRSFAEFAKVAPTMFPRQRAPQ